MHAQEFLLKPGSREDTGILVGLVDILYAFCYERRMTQVGHVPRRTKTVVTSALTAANECAVQGMGSVESGWTCTVLR